ncbi:AraC family transcriptional regulator [Paenibacillus sp. CC-CFT747]|nr:AraC family transcriptional regulator [Paenibacillus sp. CC-CFT747]
MDSKQPRRLTNEKYMPPGFPLRIFRSRISGHLEVHWHEFYEMHLILSGRGTHVLNGDSYPLKKGNLFLLTPADFHEILSQEQEPIEYYNLIFSDEMLKEPLRQLVFPDPHVPVCDVPEEEMNPLVAEFELISRESKQQRPGYLIMIQGALERILTMLSRWCRDEVARKTGSGIGKGKGTPPLQPAISRALSYIQYHFREPLTLQEAAGQAKLAPNYFSDSFRKSVGMSYQRYLQELRLRYASSLLTISRLSVTEICFASGFNTLTHFERAFKRKYGLTPRAYRSDKST